MSDGAGGARAGSQRAQRPCDGDAHAHADRPGPAARDGELLDRPAVVIAPRFNGPPASGHGGYTCGLLARESGGAADVSLRTPPPLGRPLALARAHDGRILLRDGETLVAVAVPAKLGLVPPPAVSLDDAHDATRRFAGFARHAFPRCFACGPEREQGDGLRLFAGPVAGRELVACAWRPDPGLADGDGVVRPEFAWAALDCPSAFACEASPERPIVLARLTGRVDGPLHAGEPYVVAAWSLGRDGRKHRSASVIWTADGEIVARARALWIELKNPA